MFSYKIYFRFVNWKYRCTCSNHHPFDTEISKKKKKKLWIMLEKRCYKIRIVSKRSTFLEEVVRFIKNKSHLLRFYIMMFTSCINFLRGTTFHGSHIVDNNTVPRDFFNFVPLMVCFCWKNKANVISTVYESNFQWFGMKRFENKKLFKIIVAQNWREEER